VTEEGHRIWDIVVKALAVCATLTAAFLGYKQFISEWELNNRKPYLELQSKYYLEMVEVVSKVTFPLNEEERENNIRRFWQSYTGVSALVEDDDVSEAVSGFSECLKLDKVKCTDFELEGKATALTAAIRASLLQSWNLSDSEQTH
jgi:hypothetical protein